jgi:hypothetical protein
MGIVPTNGIGDECKLVVSKYYKQFTPRMWQNVKDMNKKLETGMHTTLLVRDIKIFRSNLFSGKFILSSEFDHVLKLGVAYEEWYALRFDALGVDPDASRIWYKRFINGETEEYLIDPGYPMLSRICDPYIDAAFDILEVEQLRQECLRLQTNTSNELALQGLDKLLRVCNEAQKLEMGIYLLAQ